MPGYEQRHFAEADRRGRLRQIASPDCADGWITIHQDARVYAACTMRARPLSRASMPDAGPGFTSHAALSKQTVLV